MDKIKQSWRNVDAVQIATVCSKRHIQSVIEDAKNDIFCLVEFIEELNDYFNASPYVYDAQKEKVLKQNMLSLCNNWKDKS